MNLPYITIDQLTYVGQVLLAVLLGGIIGFQRELSGKSAGPRTYALICAGATLYTILSLNFFSNNSAIASTIVSGIGFLGIGTILHKENHIEGLTTAAGMWIVAAVGMAVGVGEFFLSTASCIIVLTVLMINDKK